MSKRPRSASQSPSAGQSPDTMSKSPSLALSAHATERSKMVLQDRAQPVVEVMRCTLPPHREALSFYSYEDYEVHYRKTHVNRCSECGRNFPTDRYLNLHIEEIHDPLIAAKRDKGEKTYSCFIEDCERKCSTPQKRRMHLIDKHMFPRSYNFYIVKDGIDEQTSMLRSPNAQRRRISASTTVQVPQEGRLRNRRTSESFSPLTSHSTYQQAAVHQMQEETEIADLERSMSALRFVPTSVVKNQGRIGSSH